MNDLDKYLKFYFLETYLFETVSKKFEDNHYLTTEDFFAIVIWKSPRSKTMVRRGVAKSTKTIEVLTSDLYRAELRNDKLEGLKGIFGIGIPIASAILTVCYPLMFTVVDKRARAAVETFDEKIHGDPTANNLAYFEYLDVCKKLANKFDKSLRDFDRILWGRDFYEGKNGLKRLAKVTE